MPDIGHLYQPAVLRIIGTIGEDGVINAAEAAGTVVMTGTVTGSPAGSRVTATLSPTGKQWTTNTDATGGWTIRAKGFSQIADGRYVLNVSCGTAADARILRIEKSAPVARYLTAEPPDGLLGWGDGVQFRVVFSAPINVTGAPALVLNNGGRAQFFDLHAPNTAVFLYEVGTGHSIGSLSVVALDMNGGTIADFAGNALREASLPKLIADLQVVATRPVVRSVVVPSNMTKLMPGDRAKIILVMSTPVLVTGDPVLMLSNGAVAKLIGDRYTSVLLFEYVVGPDEATADLGLNGIMLGEDGTATIRDLAGNGADLIGAESPLPGVTQVVAAPPAPAPVPPPPAPIPAPEPEPAPPVPSPEPTPPVPPPVDPSPAPVPVPVPASYSMWVEVQNPTISPLAPRMLTMGKTFEQGQIPSGMTLGVDQLSRIQSVQIDAKTRWPDGSVRHAIVSLAVPAMAPSETIWTKLKAIDVPVQADSRPSFTACRVSVRTIIAGGLTDTADFRAMITDAISLEPGYWIDGTIASQIRVTKRITGTLRLVLDVTTYADGTYSADVQYHNDVAMEASGGSVTYTAKISIGDSTLTIGPLQHRQYQSWHKQFWSNGEPIHHIEHDILSLKRSGSILPFDTSMPVAQAVLDDQATLMESTGWRDPFSDAGVTKYMPMTGGRTDIGPTTRAVWVWLAQQSPDTMEFMLGQADACGSVPWHLYDAGRGHYLSLDDWPTLWADGRGSPTLTQQINADDTGWTPDTAHAPDLVYVPYLVTGLRYYLDQINAVATFAIFSDWNYYRQDGLGIVANGQDQVRGQAWSLRAIDRAAHINPVGTWGATYFRRISQNNWTYLSQMIPSWNLDQGEATGRVPGDYGDGIVMSPWQQDFFATTTAQAALMGVPLARQFLDWQANFLAGRFLAGQSGFNPRDGVAYNIAVRDPSSRITYKTWAEIGAGTVARGISNGSGWAQSDGYYPKLGIASLKLILWINEDERARRALDWLRNAGPPYIDQAGYAGEPQYAFDDPPVRVA